ncbi:triose-phosphate isomerase [Pseudorhodoplanes sinuspersici]|uniref:Triosephosphate isomerase n=1 Tax=Pseudorhodoplanes sinuspersici TaxID=1235591 RepID=A0A1W6ZY40_9HYPH|nr:triose-phosphate isomerase [Pseudorhodoplanes sinuspersici]ARQ01665.1 triose-phosphate isomerase [Pseudorhodoplanes sinuspersici]RKE73388.1 triosephosphate isomerase [Pseudorhodoplanes sinuspersici]
MANDPRPLVAGNWKMNGLRGSISELEAIIADAQARPWPVDLMICPPATLVCAFAKAAAGAKIAIGAQDCHAEVSGAFTGDISAEMLKDAGASAVIVGHSERRTYHGETDDMVKAKAKAANRAGLTAIVCIGETYEEREAGATISRIERQLAGSLPETIDAVKLVIAYEPVWAIGTGLTPTPKDVEQVHQTIRKHLVSLDKSSGPTVRILYGGSVKPSNAKELMAVPNVNGALVGGASLTAKDFLGIAAAYA